MTFRSRSILVAFGALVLIPSLSSCAGSVAVEAAPDATNPECAEVFVRLSDSVSGLARRETNSQSTAAWGDPSGVILRCGVDIPGPSTDPCAGVLNVDWLMRQEEGSTYRFTTYGREPAVEVLVDSNMVSGTTVLTDLDGAVSQLPQTGKCTESSTFDGS